jgi:hypothetical protein
MFERIVYVSRARGDIGPREAYEIIRVSHNRNSSFGLTGALLLIDGYFLQVLEGDSFDLGKRLTVILADPRHEQIRLRQHTAAAGPLFAGEWMALRLDEGIAPAVRSRFDYAPGFPAERFSSERLVEFALAACAQAQASP